ncbi:MAG: ribosome maturation factor RimM [Oscillospiraceae bacterium]|nr:ribosome maturation factor RimM [Oscillospiraceae bacterium]
MQEYLEIGQIVGTHGVKGIMKVKPLTDDIKRFDKLKTVYMNIKKGLTELEIEEVRYNKNIVLLKFKGVDTIEEAETYRNFYLKVNRKDAVDLPKNSYFIVDLLGCNVYTEENEHLGEVDDVFPTGSNDVYVVKSNDGKQILIPAIKEVIKQVDIQNKTIIVKLMEGLI